MQVGPTQGHFGLQGMRERIARLGGMLAVRAIPAAAPPCSPATTMPTWKAMIEGPPARITRDPLLSEHQRYEA
jgi:hypothetical protein